jgi:hypothetical protein
VEALVEPQVVELVGPQVEVLVGLQAEVQEESQGPKSWCLRWETTFSEYR